MERNRVLWVIFSISLFLVVVMAAGLYFLRPVSREGAEMAAREAPSLRSFDAFEYVRGKSQLPELEEEREEPGDMVIIVGEKEEKLPAGKQEGQLPRAPIVPAPSPQAAPTVPEKAVAPVQSKPVQPAAAAPAARPAAKPAPREVKVTEYWIQAGSYTSPSRAEEVAAVLEEQGLASKITTRALSGKTYYRVRIGPYQSKAEADKFLEWVKAVKGFGSSYISMVYTQRRVP